MKPVLRLWLTQSLLLSAVLCSVAKSEETGLQERFLAQVRELRRVKHELLVKSKQQLSPEELVQIRREADAKIKKVLASLVIPESPGIAEQIYLLQRQQEQIDHAACYKLATQLSQRSVKFSRSHRQRILGFAIRALIGMKKPREAYAELSHTDFATNEAKSVYLNLIACQFRDQEEWEMASRCFREALKCDVNQLTQVGTHETINLSSILSNYAEFCGQHPGFKATFQQIARESDRQLENSYSKEADFVTRCLIQHARLELACAASKPDWPVFFAAFSDELLSVKTNNAWSKSEARYIAGGLAFIDQRVSDLLPENRNVAEEIRTSYERCPQTFAANFKLIQLTARLARELDP